MSYGSPITPNKDTLKFHRFETKAGEFVAGAHFPGFPGYVVFYSDFYPEDAAKLLFDNLGIDSREFDIDTDQNKMTDDERNTVNEMVVRSFDPVTEEDIAQVRQQGQEGGEPGYQYGEEVRTDTTPKQREVIKSYHETEMMDDGIETTQVYSIDYSEMAQIATDGSARSSSGLISSLVQDGYLDSFDNAGINEEASVGFTAKSLIGWHVLNGYGNPFVAK